jgi:hypothetical protein
MQTCGDAIADLTELMRCSAQTLIAAAEKATFDLWRVASTVPWIGKMVSRRGNQKVLFHRRNSFIRSEVWKIGFMDGEVADAGGGLNESV